MTTRYENTDGLDSNIAFEEQVIKPSIEELRSLLNFIEERNDFLRLNFKHKGMLEFTREEYKERILFIMDNNKDVFLPLQGRVTISRLRKEK